MTKARKLRELMARPKPIVIIGAHNGISGKIGEEAGFDGLWASGFEISASHGVPDANILTMADNLAAAKMMNDVVDIPVIADCDNGYGNAINVIRAVEEYERAGIAAICIEDNIFPKRCSFYAGVKRELADLEEHAGKIKAAKATQKDPDFMVIARTEGLIAGWGMEEALKRGRAYADAGADMVLIHSKSPTADEVLTFAKNWDRKTPLVCVPTIYKDATVDQLSEAGFKLIIFANHAMRSSIKAMTETLQAMRKGMHTGAADPYVVPLNRVYELIGVDKMKVDEKSFMPSGAPGVTAIVLGAGQSQGMLPLTEELPKPMLDIKGKTVLARQIDGLNAVGVKDVAVVRGYKKDAINLSNVRYYDNDDYAKNSELASLMRAAEELVPNKQTLVMYGDVLFERGHLEKLLKSTADVSILVDRSFAETESGEKPAHGRGIPDLVTLKGAQEAGYRFVGAEVPHPVAKVGHTIKPADGQGEFTGMVLFNQKGTKILAELLQELSKNPPKGAFHEAESFETAKITDLLQELVDRGADVQAIDVFKGWLEIDTFDDYKRAWALIKE